MKHLTWSTRFVIGLLPILALNVGRLWMTWRAPQWDGLRQVGFPFAFYEQGGFGGSQSWHFDMLVVDGAIACACAAAYANTCPDGVFAFLWRFPRWGLDHVYGPEGESDGSENVSGKTEPIAGAEGGDREHQP